MYRGVHTSYKWGCPTCFNTDVIKQQNACNVCMKKRYELYDYEKGKEDENEEEVDSPGEEATPKKRKRRSSFRDVNKKFMSNIFGNGLNDDV